MDSVRGENEYTNFNSWLVYLVSEGTPSRKHNGVS